MKTTAEKVQLINEYNDSKEYSDDYIYEFDEPTVNELFQSSYEALRSAHYGKVHFPHNYFKLDGYGNLQTLSDWEIDDLYNEIED